MRKVENLPITAPGRDQGKLFQITEMPALQAEKWAWRAFLAMARSGVEIDDEVASQGMIGIAALGLRALTRVNAEDLIPLLDEMMTCVRVVPDPQRPEVVRGLVPDDVEEITTLIQIRTEVFKLHAGFILGGVRSAAVA